jgi:hypothetical protein
MVVTDTYDSAEAHSLKHAAGGDVAASSYGTASQRWDCRISEQYARWCLERRFSAQAIARRRQVADLLRAAGELLNEDM